MRIVRCAVVIIFRGLTFAYKYSRGNVLSAIFLSTSKTFDFQRELNCSRILNYIKELKIRGNSSITPEYLELKQTVARDFECQNHVTVPATDQNRTAR